MRVTVRFGGALASAAGVPRSTVELPDGATVSDLLSLLRRRYASLGDAFDTALTVTRGVNVSGEDALADKDEISLLLPVAGG